MQRLHDELYNTGSVKDGDKDQSEQSFRATRDLQSAHTIDVPHERQRRESKNRLGGGGDD